MIFCLMDGHSRTSTELAIVGGVSPSTASVHLNRLTTVGLVKVLAQGKHRFYSLGGPDVASALEGLSVIAGRSPLGLCRARQIDYAPPGLATITWRAHLVYCCTTASGRWDGFRQDQKTITGRTMLARTAQRGLKSLASTSVRFVCYAADSLSHASIGASGGRTSAAPWVRPF